MEQQKDDDWKEKESSRKDKMQWRVTEAIITITYNQDL